MLKAIVAEILLGSIDTIEVTDPNKIEIAKKGVMHAIALSSYLAKKNNMHVFVVVTDDMWRGIVISSHPSTKENLTFCELDLGIVVGCNTLSDLSKWPEKPKVRVFLLKPSELEKFNRTTLA